MTLLVNSDTDIDELKKYEGIHCEKDSNQPAVSISTLSRIHDFTGALGALITIRCPLDGQTGKLFSL